MTMQLTLDKCGDDWDWYALHWNNFGAVNSASIEGDASEWRQVADAIERGESIRFKRVAFHLRADGSWLVFSPRNSMNDTLLTAKDVGGLPEMIRAAIAGKEQSE